MMRFMLLFSRQGKLRLQKWYTATAERDKKKMVRELMQIVLARKPKMCSFLEWRDLKIVYKRYASLYFCCAVEEQDNELITLEVIHRFVELLDKYFGSVSHTSEDVCHCSRCGADTDPPDQSTTDTAGWGVDSSYHPAVDGLF
ncbi:AP-1 complex subunit sigma-1A isoform X7 [Entelurus aequoreus]|uniref:AP-1 complex subunit sigma-1A isoform X7 n=1 Tax=Entelurus aequoreus TaxID=161455 RepID=UPI002B1D451A|nr:AP-1 complex subunit sigma-1A isoform X7 [Entelurus aequoreus]